MLGPRQSRQFPDIGWELDSFRKRCERIGDAFAGMGLLFTALAVLVAVAGFELGAPLFAASAGFALIAAFAFVIAARKLAEARKDIPRMRPAAVRVTDRLRSAERWRKAA